MDVKLAIDAIVTQTTVLIAQLATSAGMRAPLAHIANQTFLSLTRELERQGLGQKVIADMFGLALSSYQQKVQRLSESATDRGRTLWEALHDFLHQKRMVSRAEVMRRFARDDHASVRGILSDMVDSGLVFKTGRGNAAMYRAASPEEIAEAASHDVSADNAALVWVTIYRHGPLDRSELCTRLALDGAAMDAALSALCSDGRIVAEAHGDRTVYRSELFLLPLGQSTGWAAGLLDHYQAMVRAMCQKLDHGATVAQPADRIGGSTYSFDVWPGHPHAEQVYALLKEHRERLSALWSRVGDYNAKQPAAAAKPLDRVTFYFGQMVTSERELTEDLEDGQ